MFDLSAIPSLIAGAKITVVLCAMAILLGSLIGLLFGIARASRMLVFRIIGSVYVNFMRGQPLLVILFFIYFAVPLIAPMARFSQTTTGVVGLSVYAGAYIAEIVRGAVQAIPVAQSEASDALGLNGLQRLRYVVMPQALRSAVPPGIGFIISLVKSSSLVSVIGVVDLTRAGRIASSNNFEPLTTFLLVAVGYFAICYPIALAGKWYERRMTTERSAGV